MKLSSFKFSPLLTCLLGLSFSNKAYCADVKKAPTTKQSVKTTTTKSVATAKKVVNNSPKKEVIKKDKDTTPDKKNDEKVKELEKADKNVVLPKEEVVQAEESKKMEEKNNLTETAKQEKTSTELKPELSENKEEQKKNVENLVKDDKTEKIGRKRRRGRNGQKDEVAVDKKETEDKKEENKKDKKSAANSRKRNRKKSFIADDEKKDGKENSKEKVAEEANFDEPGISAEEFLNKITSLVNNYSGVNIQHRDTISRLSGKNLDWFKNTYKNYDVNGNPKFKKNDIQFKNQLIRRIDLREKINLPFFRSNKEITKYFLSGISEGKLVAFFDPFLTQKMTDKLLKEQLLMPKDVEATAGDDDNAQELFFDAHDISALEIISNWIFDKNTSDFSEDPTIIKLIIPAEKFSDTTKIQRVVCYIRYSDALDYLKNVPEASWIDEQNEAVVLSIGEAFSMGLYDSSITFLGNRDCNNGDVVDRWGSKESDPSFASRKAEDFKYKFEGSLDSI